MPDGKTGISSCLLPQLRPRNLVGAAAATLAGRHQAALGDEIGQLAPGRGATGPIQLPESIIASPSEAIMAGIRLTGKHCLSNI
jgi:hypothetical protein